MKRIAAQLAAAGMSESAAHAKAELYNRCLHQLGADGAAAKTGRALASHKPAADAPVGFFVPGRIEVLGKHTDYAGGRSLLCTLERGIVIVARPRADNHVQVTDVRRKESRELSLTADLAPTRGDWFNYVATVARRVAQNFPEAQRGADIAFASDLPADSGMSSSSALVTATFLTLSAINDLSNGAGYRAHIASNEDLATYLACVENGQNFGDLAGDKGVGTMGGSEDHTAILCCRAGALSQYSFCPVRFERRIALPPELTFVVAFSGVAAAKTGSALASYNAAADAAHNTLHAWNEATGRKDATLAAAFQCDDAATTRMRFVLTHTPALLNRFNQFALETCHLVPRAGDALASGDLELLGELVDASQHAAETLLDNQIAETIFLARSARKAGAHAASTFGAGFGGSVWALIDTEDTVRFTNEWREMYRQTFPGVATRAEFVVTSAGPPALQLSADS